MNTGCTDHRAHPASPAGLSQDHSAWADSVPFDNTVPVVSPTSRPPSGRRRSFFLPLSAGTFLAVVGFLGPLVYEELTGTYRELRGDLKHFNETCSTQNHTAGLAGLQAKRPKDGSFRLVFAAPEFRYYPGHFQSRI